MTQKMEIILLLLSITIFYVTNGAPIENKKEEPKIVTYKFRQLPNNGYHFFYKLSDGQTRDEFASFDNAEGILRITGTYSYIGDDKKEYSVSYTADENGYVVKTDAQSDKNDVEKGEPITLSLAAIATLGSG